jgi:hypothetical protein
MANIPHGTSLVAQGIAQVFPGPPQFQRVDITPFFIGTNPRNFNRFPSQDLSTPSNFRSPPGDIVGITQAMINDPNSVLQAALVGKTITSTTVIRISTSLQPIAPTVNPVPGGPLPVPPPVPPVPDIGSGVSNIAFLDGPAGGPNARVVEMDATFWISTFTDANGSGTLLQYSQIVFLNFAPLTWPHVSVANLIKQVSKAPIKDVKDHKVEIKEHKPEIKEHKPEIKEHKPEIKEHKPEIKEHKVEIKEQDFIPQPVEIPDPALRAGPAEAAPPAGRPFIEVGERPAVGDAILKNPPDEK